MLDNISQPFDDTLVSYLGETLNLPLNIRPTEVAIALPAFLGKRYRFAETDLLGVRCVLAIDPDHTPPGQVAKHLEQIQARLEGSTRSLVIYVTDRLTAATRSKLVAQHTPFIVPGSQLYLPQLALVLRERFSARPKRQHEQLSPAAQAVLFFFLLRRDVAANSASLLAEALSYSAMSVGRAFAELAQFDLARVVMVGRSKTLELPEDRQALLMQARPVLRSPVRARHHLQGQPNLLLSQLAGETALAELTDLSTPKLTTTAMHHPQWQASAMAGELLDVDDEAFDNDDAAAVVELWHYQPAALSSRTTVDPLSLYATYWDHADERVAQAAEDLLESLPW